MASTFKVNRGAVREILRSPEMLADMEARAERIASSAGPGMEVSSMVGRSRARASVITATAEAREAEAKDRRLTAALAAGRG